MVSGVSDFMTARDRLFTEEGVAIAFFVKSWKREYLVKNLPRKRIHFADLYLDETRFGETVLPLMEAREKPIVVVWGNNLPVFAEEVARRCGLDIFYLEDGFLRSTAAHAGYSPPYSMTFDRKRPYFDARGASDLEDLLLTYDFDNDPELLARARRGIETIRKAGVTKYNGASRQVFPLELLNVVEGQRRILVIGQVEEDASIRYGCNHPVTNNDLVRMAARENPNDVIIYKPHPDILSGVRKGGSDQREIAHLCYILEEAISLPDVLEYVDHVYTITSLGGFEALLRGKSVTVTGCPFYAGWGLTDDRQDGSRRGRRLSAVEVFAAAYILYPVYFDVETGDRCDFETALEKISQKKPPVKALFRESRWRPWGPYGLIGWRHLLTPVIAFFIERMFSAADAELYRSDPRLFFRELDNPILRRIGRILYPW